MWFSIIQNIKFLKDITEKEKTNFDYVCRFRSDIFVINQSNFLKNSLEMTNKIANKAQPLFAKELSTRLGYPEDTEKTEEKIFSAIYDAVVNVFEKVFNEED